MKGKMTCPICAGKGKITEDSQEYEFQTRDPHTQTCLTCSGTGEVAPRKKLPDGRAVCDLEPKAAKQKPKAKAPSGWDQKRVAAFKKAPSLKRMLADTFLEDADVEAVLRVADQNEFIQAKVLVVKFAGSRENVTDSIIQLLDSI